MVRSSATKGYQILLSRHKGLVGWRRQSLLASSSLIEVPWLRTQKGTDVWSSFCPAVRLMSL